MNQARLRETDDAASDSSAGDAAPGWRAIERVQTPESLVALGTFAAGLAHEMRNPVGAALLAAETAADRNRAGESFAVAAALKLAIRSLERCRDIIDSILSLSRNELRNLEACDPVALTRDARDAVREYAAAHRATIELQVPPGLPRLRANVLQMHLALVNVLRNAVEAGASTIVIRGAMRGGRVDLTIEDDGRGIAGEPPRRLFEPLRTTRSHKGGAGLGLSLCTRILAAHGGAIAIDNRLDGGAVVTISLPAMS